MAVPELTPVPLEPLSVIDPVPLKRDSEVEPWTHSVLVKAEKLYPQTTDLPEAKALLDKVKRGAISLG